MTTRFCPNCGRPAETDADAGRLCCEACGTCAGFGDAGPVPKLPAGATSSRVGAGEEVEWSARRPESVRDLTIGTAALACLLVVGGFTLLGYGTPCIAIALILAAPAAGYAWLSALVKLTNRTRLLIHPLELSVRHGPLSPRRTRKLDPRRVRRIGIEDPDYLAQSMNERVSVYAELTDGRRVRLGPPLQNSFAAEDLAAWLRHRLRTLDGVRGAGDERLPSEPVARFHGYDPDVVAPDAGKRTIENDFPGFPNHPSS